MNPLKRNCGKKENPCQSRLYRLFGRTESHTHRSGSSPFTGKDRPDRLHPFDLEVTGQAEGGQAMSCHGTSRTP